MSNLIMMGVCALIGVVFQFGVAKAADNDAPVMACFSMGGAFLSALGAFHYGVMHMGTMWGLIG